MWRLLIYFTLDRTPIHFLLCSKKKVIKKVRTSCLLVRMASWTFPKRFSCRQGRSLASTSFTKCSSSFRVQYHLKEWFAHISIGTTGSSGNTVWAVLIWKGVKSLGSLEVWKLRIKESKNNLAQKSKATPNLVAVKTSDLKSETNGTTIFVSERVFGLMWTSACTLFAMKPTFVCLWRRGTSPILHDFSNSNQ